MNQKSGDLQTQLTDEEAISLAGLLPAAAEFVVAVKKLFPGAELVDVRRGGPSDASRT